MRNIVLLLLGMLAFSPVIQAKKQVITFDLKFGIIKGGEARLVISDTLYNSKKAIHYYLEGRTTGLTDKLFGVNDIYETTVDAKTRLPLKAIRNIREKKYRYYNETFFYHDIDSIYCQRMGWRSAPHNLVDIISVFFYFIDQHLMDDIELGHKVALPTYHADVISNVSVTYLGSEKTETNLGLIDCYVLNPQVDKGKLFNRSDGLKFYISKKDKTPVLLDFDMRVGALRALLKSYKIDGVEQVTK